MAPRSRLLFFSMVYKQYQGQVIGNRGLVAIIDLLDVLEFSCIFEIDRRDSRENIASQKVVGRRQRDEPIDQPHSFDPISQVFRLL